MAFLSLRDLLHPDMGNWSCEESGEAHPVVKAPSRQDDLDALLLAASQKFEHDRADSEGPLPKHTRFGAPVSPSFVENSQKAGIPPKTQQQTSWACQVWKAWVGGRKQVPLAESQEAKHELFAEFGKMPVELLKYWLPIFFLGARRSLMARSTRQTLCIPSALG